MPQATENIVEKFGPEKLAVAWPKRLFIFSLLIFIIATAIYFGLAFGYGPLLESQIVEKEKQISSLTEQVPEEKQKEFIKFYSQLTNLKNLLDNHIVATKILPVLEKYAVPGVSYSSFDLNIPDKQLELDGAARDYQTLATQLAGYETARTEIISYAISEAKLAEGKVIFKANLSLSPNLFK